MHAVLKLAPQGGEGGYTGLVHVFKNQIWTINIFSIKQPKKVPTLRIEHKKCAMRRVKSWLSHSHTRKIKGPSGGWFVCFIQ